MINADKIYRIEEIYKQETLLEKERRSIPHDAEYSKDRLKVIYAITRAKASEKRYETGKIREYFLFVSLYVFDPNSLVRKMRRGMRTDLAAMMGVSENNVSKITKHILFRFRIYKCFQAEVNEIHDEVLAAFDKIDNKL